MNCRFCKTPLRHEFVDLGHSPPSNAYLLPAQLNEPETYFPLKLYVCHQCWLVQVDEYQRADQIFNHQYAYFSSYSRSWLDHSQRYTEYMINRFNFNENSRVVEVASNDGYLLQFFKARGVPVLGIEPTANTAAVAQQKGIETIVEFFDTSLARRLVAERGQADLIVGNNVLAHVPNINDFVQAFKIALKQNGVITMEFPHLLRLILDNQFDTIYHEHFSYLSLTSVSRIFDAHELEIFDVQEVPTHGGSLRIFVMHKDDHSKSIAPTIDLIIRSEREAGITNLTLYRQFQERTVKLKTDFLRFLVEKKINGAKIVAYGAAAKGNTLLNYCGVRRDLIQFVVDASPYKQGKFLPGSHIPVFTEARIREEKPDYILILPWNIKEEIMSQLSYVKSWGCKFVVVIPELLVY